MHERTSGLINQWTNDWLSEWVSRWINESVNQWITGSVNQLTNEPMNPGMQEPMNQWIHEPMNHWTNEWRDGWMDEWVWIGEQLFFVELLLHWATSSLRRLFSQLLLLWAAYLGYFCSELPPSYSFAGSAAQLFSSRSCRDAFSSLQLQFPTEHKSSTMVKNYLFVQLLHCVWPPPAAIPLASARNVAGSLMLGCTQQCQCVVSQPVANPHSRSVTAKWPTFAQHWQCGRFLATPRTVFFLNFFFWCTFRCRPHLPKVFRSLHFLNMWSANQAPPTVWCAFCRQLS